MKTSSSGSDFRRVLAPALFLILPGEPLGATGSAIPTLETPPSAEGRVAVGDTFRLPRVVGDWWQVAGVPDLGELTTEKQQPADFAIWQAGDGTWQIWSCIRHTQEVGRTRLFHRWEGATLTSPHWRPMGVAMRADPKYGEYPGGLQAPHVVRADGGYVMVYGDWVNICAQEGRDGKTFTRRLGADGRTGMFGKDFASNTRDPMLLRTGDRWICYYTAHPQGIGSVYARTSPDLRTWGEEVVVAGGGDLSKAIKAAYAAECPFVVEPRPGEFYLFSTQRYGTRAHTTVYASRDPLDFRVEGGRGRMLGTLPIAAPELVKHGGEWFVAALRRDLKGIQIARLAWE